MDRLMEELGGCGVFQVLLKLAMYAITPSLVGGMLMMVFGSYDPGWSCMKNGVKYNTTSFCESAATQTSNCTSTQNNNIPSDTCDLLSSCDEVIFNPGSSTVVTEWQLICDQAWVVNAMITIQMAGGLVGSNLAGFFGDRFGRKVCLYGSIALFTVMNCSAIFSVNWQMFTVFRFFIGVGAGGIFSGRSIYSVEFFNQDWRGRLTSVPSWSIGAVLFSIVVLLLKDWRSVQIFISSVSLLALLPVFWTPESMRWLFSNGRLLEAKVVTDKIASLNKRPPPSMTMLREVASSEDIAMSNSRKYNYSDLFKTKDIRISSIKIGTVWMCTAVVYYAITFGVKSLPGDFYLNFVLFSLAEIPGAIFVAPTANLLGRRWSVAIHLLLAAVHCFSVVLVTFLTNDLELRDSATTILALIAKALVIGGWEGVNLFTFETYPTVIRSLGYGYVDSLWRISSMLAPFVFPSQVGLLWVFFLAVGVLMLVSVALILSMEETLGKPLPDTLET